MMAPVMVEEVGKGLPGRAFADLALALGSGHPGAEWLLAGQRRRLQGGSPPDGQAARLLASRNGRPVARLSAHRQADGTGSFGFLAIEDPDQVDALRALLAAAASWLGERGASSMIGPLSWTAADEAGVLVAGHELAAVTGRAWNPPWYGAALEAAGLEVAEELCSYRLPALDDANATTLTRAPFAVASDLARFADPALLLEWTEGDGSVVAVPDVAGGLRPGEGVGRAWSLARQARRREWAGCVITALDGPESVLVPALCAAAGRAGYQWVLSPWAPSAHDIPIMRHRLYRGEVARWAAHDRQG
jgi:hypothetical protein